MYEYDQLLYNSNDLSYIDWDMANSYKEKL